MNSTELWPLIHAERRDLAETIAGLTSEQWQSKSWCGGWTVGQTAGHVVAAAEQTFGHFYVELIAAGFSFDRFAEKGATRVGSATPSELATRLRARTTTTNHPPAPVMAMLGEIVVHGDDIRRPLGQVHRTPVPALVAVADSWKNSNLLIGSKRRITGLRLVATDAEWSHGDGPLVSGSLQSLVLAMTGRKGAHGDLTGDGVAVLATRP